MLKSVSVWALKNSESRPADWVFAEARERGFEAIELAIGLRGLVTPDSTEKDCESLVQMARAEGIRISSLASGLGWQFPLTADDPEVRRKGVEMIRKSIYAARWLQVKALLVVPGTLATSGAESKEHVPYDVAYDRMEEGLTHLVPVAEELGVVLGIENVWNRLLLSPIEMRDFIDDFVSDAVGCYLDVGNKIILDRKSVV
jgi:L-ribulose-5-phosphate 3-epimerase